MHLQASRRAHEQQYSNVKIRVDFFFVVAGIKFIALAVSDMRVKENYGWTGWVDR